VKKNPPLPTVTVTVVPLATRGKKVRSEVIVNAAAKMCDEELFMAPIFRYHDCNGLPSHTMLEK